MIAMWVVATLVTIGLAWFAVFSVLFDVTDRPMSLLVPTRVAANIDEHAHVAQPVAGPTTGAGVGSVPTTTVPTTTVASSAPPPARPAPPSTATSRTVPPTTAVKPSVPSGGAVVASPPVTVPPAATSGAGAPPTTSASTNRTFASVGGLLTVSCAGSAAGIFSAAPSVGFRYVVHASGPEEVDVSFMSPGHESEIAAHCSGGTPVGSITESG
jgi:hypothetical protein